MRFLIRMFNVSSYLCFLFLLIASLSSLVSLLTSCSVEPIKAKGEVGVGDESETDEDYQEWLKQKDKTTTASSEQPPAVTPTVATEASNEPLKASDEGDADDGEQADDKQADDGEVEVDYSDYDELLDNCNRRVKRRNQRCKLRHLKLFIKRHCDEQPTNCGLAKTKRDEIRAKIKATKQPQPTTPPPSGG